MIRGRRRRGVAFAAIAALAAMSAAAAPSDTLRECAARAAAATEGLAALEAQCPGLGAALSELGYPALLSDAQQRRLKAAGLGDLAALAQRYRADRRAIGPDVAPVHGIVDALARERASAPSAWEALKAWLRSLIAREGDLRLSWLDQWLDKLAAAGGVMAVLAYGLLAVALILAAVFIVAELRATGLLRRRRRAHDRPSGEARLWDGAPRTATLDTAPLADQPAILLGLLVDGLSRKGRLRGDRHLTHRELIRCAILEDGAQRARFARVATLAEALLYGPEAGSEEGLAGIVDEGRLLLAQVDRLSAAA